MLLSGNTLLITGGGSGIGLGLAKEFLKLGNRVIVAGRSKDKLYDAAALGLETFTVDMSDPTSIENLARHVIEQFPDLNAVIHSAGIMKNENLLRPDALGKTREETITTNLLGPMRLNDALIPHFKKQPRATIMTVTSGLAFLPLAITPTYSATKAAIHSYTESLRYQLKETSIEVLELAPPYVQTMLMGERQANDPHAMPLKDFIGEVMRLLKERPDATEILVERVHPLRFASEKGSEGYRNIFTQFNDAMKVARASEL